MNCLYSTNISVNRDTIVVGGIAVVGIIVRSANGEWMAVRSEVVLGKQKYKEIDSSSIPGILSLICVWEAKPPRS